MIYIVVIYVAVIIFKCVAEKVINVVIYFAWIFLSSGYNINNSSVQIQVNPNYVIY